MLKPKEKILLYSNNLWMLGEGMLGPLFAVFVQQIGGNILEITWAWAVYLIIAGLLHIVTGRVCDRLKRPEVMLVLGFALNAVFTFAYLWVDSSVKLFIVQAGLGLALAITNPPWYALYARYEDRHHDAYTWGVFRGEALLITGIAMVIGGFIVKWSGFTTLFIVMGTLQVAATLYQAKLLRRVRD